MNSIRSVIAVILTFFGFVIQSQNNCNSLYDNNWILGGKDDTIDGDKYGGTIIRFFPDLLITEYDKKVSQKWTAAEISSKDGDLLLYTNGCDIFDFQNNIIENGANINPGELHDLFCVDNNGYPGLNSMFYLPSAYDTSIFFLIHIAEVINHLPNPLFGIQAQYVYSTTISNNGDLDKEEVIIKNEILLNDTSMLGAPICAVRHANGKDWWILIPDRWSNGYFTFKVDSTGPNFIHEQYIGDFTNPKAEGAEGKFSPDGLHFAWYHPKNGVFLFSFDRETGSLDDFKRVDTPESDFIAGGCEFSPNSRYLYINTDTSLYQLDLQASDIQGSLMHIADYDRFGAPLPTSFLYMALTPDNRIFMNTPNGTQYLHVIENPNEKGLACNFIQHAIKLPTVNYLTMPNFPNYRLSSINSPLCDSLTNNIGPILTRNKFKVYPNPTSNYLVVECADNSELETIFFKILELITTSGNYMDVANLPSGIYFLSIKEGQGSGQLVKIIKSY